MTENERREGDRERRGEHELNRERGKTNGRVAWDRQKKNEGGREVAMRARDRGSA